MVHIFLFQNECIHYFLFSKLIFSNFKLKVLLDHMADGCAQSRYVQLTRDQAPSEDITPGELNQPVQVPQVLLCCVVLLVECNRF